MEMIEIEEHPFFIASQFHPEFKSRPTNAHPLFRGLVEAALEYSGQRTGSTSDAEEAAPPQAENGHHAESEDTPLALTLDDIRRSIVQEK